MDLSEPFQVGEISLATGKPRGWMYQCGELWCGSHTGT